MLYSTDIISRIITQTEKIDAVTILKFPVSNLLQNRIQLNPMHIKILDLALETRQTYQLPFWDSVLLTQFDYLLFSKEIINEAQLHNPIKKKIIIKSNEWNNLFGGGKKSEENIGFNSSIIVNNTTSMHLPLLDFHIPNIDSNIPCVTEVIEQLNLKGYLLKTNKSFHFYGTQLLDDNQFINFLARALLYSPIIDKNWISHQLMERSATLRITSKDGETPYLIKKIGIDN